MSKLMRAVWIIVCLFFFIHLALFEIKANLKYRDMHPKVFERLKQMGDLPE